MDFIRFSSFKNQEKPFCQFVTELTVSSPFSSKVSSVLFMAFIENPTEKRAITTNKTNIIAPTIYNSCFNVGLSIISSCVCIDVLSSKYESVRDISSRSLNESESFF